MIIIGIRIIDCHLNPEYLYIEFSGVGGERYIKALRKSDAQLVAREVMAALVTDESVRDFDDPLR